MLHEPNLERHQGSEWQLLLMLGLASRSGWDDVKIASVLGIPVTEATAKRLDAYRLCVLDTQTHLLTAFGRGLVDRIRAAARKKRSLGSRTQRPLDETYYPLSCDGLVRH